MRCRSLTFCVAAILLAAAASQAQEYTIKFKLWPEAAKSVTVTDNNKQTTSYTITDTDGKELKKDKSTTTTNETYTDAVIEAGTTRPAKFKRTYEKATKTAGNETQPAPYEGRTIAFQLKDSKYVAKADGAPAVPQPVLDDLANRSSSSDDEAAALLPSKPVKVGDKWALDPKVLAKVVADEGQFEIDPDKSKGDVTLKKAYKQDGCQFGVLDMSMNLAVKKMGGLNFDTPGTMELKATFDVPIDASSTAGTVTTTTTIKGKANMIQMGQKLIIDLTVDGSEKKTVSAEKAAAGK